MNFLSKLSITVVALVAVTGLLEAETPKTIKLVTSEWEGYTQADGKGIYWDVLRAVFEKEGVEIDLKLVPWKRAQQMTQAGKVDAIVAEYHIPTLYKYPHYHLDVDTVTAFYKKGKIKDFKGLDSLKDKSLGWFRGYGYESRFKDEIDYSEFNDLSQGLTMLTKGRIDVILDFVDGFELVVKEAGLSMDMFEQHDVFDGKTYLCFYPGGRSKKLIEFWDKRMKALDESGELDKIYKNYSEIYPEGYIRN